MCVKTWKGGEAKPRETICKNDNINQDAGMSKSDCQMRPVPELRCSLWGEDAGGHGFSRRGALEARHLSLLLLLMYHSLEQFFNLSTVDTWSRWLCLKVMPAHCRVVSSILVLNPQMPPSTLWVVTTKRVSRYYQLGAGAKVSPVENSGLQHLNPPA